MQETLLRTWQVAPRYTGDGRPNGLLRLAVRMARNLAIDELRRKRLETVAIEKLLHALESRDVEEPTAPDPFLRQAIAWCRQRLGGRPGAALTARLEAGGTEPDHALAAGLDMKLNTFLQNITRARRLLAACLKRKGIDLELERP